MSACVCFSVSAVYNSVRGSCSEAGSFTTHCSVPDVPLPPKLSHRTKSTLTLQWKVQSQTFYSQRQLIKQFHLDKQCSDSVLLCFIMHEIIKCNKCWYSLTKVRQYLCGLSLTLTTSNKETLLHCCIAQNHQGASLHRLWPFSHKLFLSTHAVANKEWHKSPRQDMRPIIKNTTDSLSRLDLLSLANPVFFISYFLCSVHFSLIHSLQATTDPKSQTTCSSGMR